MSHGALRSQLRQVLKPHGKNILPKEIEVCTVYTDITTM